MFDPTRHYKTNPSRRVYENPKPDKHAIHVVTGIGRINYPSLAAPRKGENGGADKFGSMILLPSLEHNVEVQKAIADVAAKAFGGSWLAENAKLSDTKKVKIPLKRQTELSADYDGKGDAERAQYDEAGVFFRANSMFKPAVTNSRGLPMDDASVAAIKSGDFVIAEVAFFAYQPSPGKPNRGVSARIIGIQFVAPGLPFATKRQSNFGVLDIDDIPAHAAPAGVPSEAELFG